MDAPPPPPPGGPPTWMPPGVASEPRTPRRVRRLRGWIAIAIAVLLAVAAILLIGAALHSQPVAQNTSTGTQFTDPTNHFSATFHDKPVEQQQGSTVAGRHVNEVLWSDTIDANTAEIVGYADFPATFTIADPHNALDGSVNGEVQNSNGSLVSKTFGTYAGHPSVDALIQASGGYIETRAVLAGHTLYVVVVTSTHNPPELFAGFASSLHIENHAA